ncbi:MAG: ATP-binding cassette domain-containing protein [Bacteroidales bacterium]
MKELFYLIEKQKSKILLFFILTSLLFGIEAFFHPILLKEIFDRGVIEKNFQWFTKLCLFYFLLGLFLNLSGLKLDLWGKSLENSILHHIIRKLTVSYFSKDYIKILSKDDGYFIGRIYKDNLEGILPFLNTLRMLIINFVRIVIFMFVLFYLSWKASLLLFAVVPIIMYFSNKFGEKIKRLAPQERENEANFLGVLSKLISSFKIIKSFGLLDPSLCEQDRKLWDFFKINYQKYKVEQIYRTSVDVGMNISDSLTLFIGALFVLRGELTFGAYLAFVNTFWRTVTGIMDFFKPIPQLKGYYTVIKRIYNFEKDKAERYYEEGKDIIMDKIYFSYDGEEVFKDFSLRINQGERVVIIGGNGSGKTTLALILSGLLRPQQGKVILPKKISSLTLPLMFPPLKIKDMIENKNLAKKLGVKELEEDMPDDLSMGQRQRMGILLALSKEADLYIFDEPLANIDEESKNEIMKTIFETVKNKTLVAIMHGNKAYYNYFDRIIDLDKIKEKSGI